ncbi:MAG: DNA cytosine methyltransferase [Phycisphaerales bacterium]
MQLIRRPANPRYAARLSHRHRSAAMLPQVLDLFSGIGGFSLGLECAGFQTAAFCEIDPFCRSVLARHWPATPIYHDIHQLTARRLHHDRITHIDLICGGYPCQPFSVAGKQRGENDPRHLWPQMHRLIREFRPRWVVCENVRGHVELGLDTVLDDLESLGYTAWPFVVPACAVGAPHRRDRLWVVAHTAGIGLPRALGQEGRQPASQLPAGTLRWELPQPFTVGGDDGIPYRLERAQALGNAVVPQIPELIGKAIRLHESRSNAPRSCRWDFTRRRIHSLRDESPSSVKSAAAAPVSGGNAQLAAKAEAVCI